MSFRAAFLIGLLALMWAPLALAQATAETPPEEVFWQANQAYDEGQVKAARDAYQALIDGGFESGPLQYNLGNSLLRTGELGEAVAAYKRSLALAPRDADTRANLNFARQSTKDAVAAPQPSALSRTLLFWHHGLSLTEKLWGALLLNVLFWGLLLLTRFRGRRELGNWLLLATGTPLLALVASVSVGVFAPQSSAVVLHEEITVYSGTSTESTVRFVLHEGTEAQVLERAQGWVSLNLSDGKRGWVQQSDVALLVE